MGLAAFARAGPCWLLLVSLALGAETCFIPSKLEWNCGHRRHLLKQDASAQQQQKHKPQGRAGNQVFLPPVRLGEGKEEVL